jgi:hypothetical protein
VLGRSGLMTREFIGLKTWVHREESCCVRNVPETFIAEIRIERGYTVLPGYEVAPAWAT